MKQTQMKNAGLVFEVSKPFIEKVMPYAWLVFFLTWMAYVLWHW